jgi:heme/copper-type cytochrome/quinol oxidase subunit 3
MPRPPLARAPFLNIARLWIANKLGELLIWAVLVVFFSLLPIYLVYNDKRVGGQFSVPLKELVVKGELLLVAAALAADSLSRLASRMFANRGQAGVFRLRQLVLFLASIAFLILAASEYSGLVSRDASSGFVNVDYVFTQSKVFFIATLLTGAGVILAD